ncbi:MAG: hypothetical protein ABR512_02670 [Desulfopila sp.]
MLDCDAFFDLSDNAHPQLLQEKTPVWQALNTLKQYMLDYSFQTISTSPLLKKHTPLERTIVLYGNGIIDAEDCIIAQGKTTEGGLQVFLNGELLPGASVVMAGACFSGDAIEIGRGSLIEPGTMIKSPTIIGDNNEVRQGAYLRGHIITGRGCILGHATEIKHTIFLNDAKAGHFNYLGDSILGNNTNLGAGTKLANLKFMGGNIIVEHQEERHDTGRKKLGAILGDDTRTGCNSVTNPGTLLGKGCLVMPNTTVRTGYHGPASVLR